MQNGQITYTNSQVVSIEEYEALKEAYSGLQAEYLYLKQKLAQLKRMIFGSKSERYIANYPGQLSLGLDVEEAELPERDRILM
ncbi:MAG: transposase [Bacteroidota bacterium]